LFADVGVEVAIGAFGEAEGPVDVEGEGGHRAGIQWVEKGSKRFFL
jgi:hypothetical protein